MVHLIGIWLKSMTLTPTVTHLLTAGRGALITSGYPQNCGSKAMGFDRASSSTEVSSGSGANAKEGNEKTGVELLLEERLEKWKNNVNLDILTDNQRLIHDCHLKAVEESRETYNDPDTGYEVLTILTHLKRGLCCGNACRHCPYSHANVPLSAQGRLCYNSAFYS